MNNRSTFTFKNSKVEERSKEIHETDFVVSKRSIDLFRQGKGGLSSEIDMKSPQSSLVGAQSYIGLLNLDTLEIELVPAEKSFDFEDKTYGIFAANNTTGTNVGYMHNEALIQTSLVGLGNNAGRILGFALLKGDGVDGKPEPLILNFLNKSTSQNGNSVEYTRAFRLFNYHLDENHFIEIQRSIPKVLSEKIMVALCKQLPCLPTQLPTVFTTRNDNFASENEFQSFSDEAITKRLIENMFIAVEKDDRVTFEAIYSLKTQFPQLSLHAFNDEGKTLLSVAKEKKLTNFIYGLTFTFPNIGKIDSSVQLIIDTAKAGNAEYLQSFLSNFPDKKLYTSNIENPQIFGDLLTWSLTETATGVSVLSSLINCGTDIKAPISRSEIKIDLCMQDANGNTPLLLAAEKNLTSLIKSLINAGVDINHENKKKESALLFAVANNNLEVVKIIIENKGNLNQANKDGRNALFLSILKNNLTITKLLLDEGFDVNKQDKYGKTAAMYAIEFGHEKAALFCINNMGQSMLDHLDNNANCALSIAIEKNQSKTAHILLQMGANPHQALYSIMHARNHNYVINAEEKIQFLVHSGADLNAALKIAHDLGDFKSEETIQSEINKTNTYKQQIKHYLTEQINRLPDSEKRKKFEALSNNLNECKCIKDAKDMAAQIKEISYQHQTSGLTGFFKLNWLKQPESYKKAVNDLNFEDEDSLWNLRNS